MQALDSHRFEAEAQRRGEAQRKAKKGVRIYLEFCNLSQNNCPLLCVTLRLCASAIKSVRVQSLHILYQVCMLEFVIVFAPFAFK
jgi:hypothetical protein